MKKIAIFGIDCLNIDLIARLKKQMPFLNSLLNKGNLKVIRSCDPPITIPAWSVMTTGHDPGELGVYGFSKRLSRQNYEMSINDSRSILKPRIWQNYLKSFTWGVPQTAPHLDFKANSVEGGCILNKQVDFMQPKHLEEQFKILLLNNLQFDIKGYRGNDLAIMQNEVKQMLLAKDNLICHALKQDYDFFMIVLIESDRVNHAFWQHSFSDHISFIENSQFSQFLPEFYQKLDELLKKWFALAYQNNYLPILISDHGVKPLKGVVALNEALVDLGYLCLKKPDFKGILSFSDIDIANSKALFLGGYCARLYVFQKGRDPLGSVLNMHEFLKEIETKLKNYLAKYALKIDFLLPKNIYKRVANIAPDAILYLNDLDYRASSGIYTKQLIYLANDTGPDGVNHSLYSLIGTDLNKESINNIIDFKTFLEGIK